MSMFLGMFTERPYQDPDSGISGAVLTGEGRLASPDDTVGSVAYDLGTSNSQYNPRAGHQLYNRYFDEKVYAEEMGFDGFMLNEHHSSMFCMGQVLNVEASILARITKKAKILLLGNVLPIWDDPLWLAETLAEIDVISGGRLIPGWVRGTGRESFTHNTATPFNWERYQEAHDLIIKAWSDPGPFRWEGKHFQYRYVNPWVRPFMQPHMPMWIPGTLSRNTVEWAARHRYPFIMISGEGFDAMRECFDYYGEVAKETGFEAGPEHFGCVVRVHVEATDEQAYDVGRKFLQGPGNPFLEGNEAPVRRHVQGLPGLSARDPGRLLPTARNAPTLEARGLKAQHRLSRETDFSSTYDNQLRRQKMIVGSPKTVIEKLKVAMETVRAGSMVFWGGDGSMTHEDSMRSLTLLGQEVLPALREHGKALGLKNPYDFDPVLGSVG